MTPDQYLDALLTLPDLQQPLISPDGQWAAWTWYNAGPSGDVYVAPTNGSSPPTRLTDTPDDVLAVSWTLDSRALLVQQDHEGDERVQLFQVNVARPGVMLPLTEPSPEYYVRGGQLHPNDRWLVYAANFDAATGRPIEASWIYRHDLPTGERKVLARPLRAVNEPPLLNAQGTHILYNRNDLHPAGNQVWLVDIEGQSDREILNFGPDVKVQASWFPDGRRVLFLAEAGTYRRLGIWDQADGGLSWLLDDPARNIERAFIPHGSRHAVIVEFVGARVRASLLDLETAVELRVPAVPGNLVPLAPLDDRHWIGTYYSSLMPTDLVRFALDAQDPKAFVSLTGIWERTSLRPGDLVPAEDYRWQSVDRLEIQGWLYRTRTNARGTIVYVHGGPTWLSEDYLNAEIQFLVAQGFNVLAPNYRGSTGFNLAFQELIKVDGWGGREQDDIRTGIEALIRDGIAVPGRVGVTGTSYGGYSSWCAITRWPPALVTAAAPICGMTDLVVDYETTRPDLRPYSEEMLGGRPDQVPERYRERSPINFVSQIQGRLLIVQGMKDPNVTPENVRAVRVALEKAGVEYELLTFDDEGHGIARPKNLKQLYLRLVAFFDSAFVVADRPAPVK